MITCDFDILTSAKCDVCVVGSGPVGRALALDLNCRGLSVLVLESGLVNSDQRIQSLSDAFIKSPQAHHRMDHAISRSLGGTSRLWGGRCVFLDEIDFEKREYVQNSGWPINLNDIVPYFERAAELLGCDGNFTIHDWTPSGDSNIDVANLERWVNETRLSWRLREVDSGDGITCLLNATVVGIEAVPGTRLIRGLHVERDGRKESFRGAKFYVLAMGGIESARLLLNVQTKHPRLFGGPTGPLGRYYMGHLSGSIASIRFFKPEAVHRFANIEGSRSFGRRRLRLSSASQREHRLPNIAFWPENPNYTDARHASGILSAIALVLRFPGFGPKLVSEAILHAHDQRFSNVWPHLRNVVTDVQGTVAGAGEILRQRFRYGRRLPRLFVTNRHGVYPLRFHAEQLPNLLNGIRLSSERDWLGVRRAVVEFDFSVEEMRKVIEAHKIFDRSLRYSQIGELIYHDVEGLSDPLEQLQHLAADGLHQIGLTRMAQTATNGVIDKNCRIFEFQNLFIAGSSIFPTSGQASPTLPAVALAVRLSEHIAKLGQTA